MSLAGPNRKSGAAVSREISLDWQQTHRQGSGSKTGTVLSEKTSVLTIQFSSMEHDAFHVPYLLDTTPEAVFHGQAVKTVAYLRVSTTQQVSGRKLGRPKGSLGVSRLDGKQDDIRRFLELGVSKTAIAKITGVSRTTLYSFMSTRGLRPSP